MKATKVKSRSTSQSKKRRSADQANTSADLTHISESAKLATEKQLHKQKTAFLQNYYREDTSSSASLILSNESLLIPSKYQALSDLLLREEHLELNITTVGLWGCNIGSAKLTELCTTAFAKGGIKRIELCELKKEIKKKAVLALAELFQVKKKDLKSPERGVAKKGKGLKYSLMIQRCNISHKNITLLLKKLSGSSIAELSLIQTLHNGQD